MQRVAIVTDSTADLPKELVEKYDIQVVPLNVIFGEETFKDGVDLDSHQFFDKLIISDVHPYTSQPSPGEFLEVYERLLEDYDAIVSIHISSKLSGTFQSAEIASQMLSGKDITVLDSYSVTLGIGQAVLAAAQASQEGKSKEDIIGAATKVIKSTRLLFTVETLEFLEKGGRIGKASALLGTLLNLHPILQIADGEVQAHSKVRGRMSKVIKAMVDASGKMVPFGSKIKVAVIHSNAVDRVQELLNLVEDAYDVVSTVKALIGPVIGVHSGPGAVGLIIVPIDEA